MTNQNLPDPDGWDDPECFGDTSCPNCGLEYDEVDYEYQICHICKFNNNDTQTSNNFN